MMKDDNKAAQKSRLGIYIHIPFCLARCRYCGFYSMAGSTADERRCYVDGLIEDIHEYGRVYGEQRIVDTVFIGGGTPSILEHGEIERIMSALRGAFAVADDAEITIESNPKTLDREKLAEYRRAGVNRLSIGLQSFDPGCLKTLGRVHTVEDFVQNYEMARECGFDNINIDLMFAIPGHTMGIWEDTLDRAIALKPEHISFYSLQIEEGTPLYEMFITGEFDQIPDDLDRIMYHRAIEKLKAAGYEHYEISNAARPGKACRHNLKYWSMEEYLGIGSGASSYMEGVRFTEEPVFEFHENSLQDDMSEYVFTGLRKTCGISLSDFQERFGMKLWEAFGDRRESLSEFFDSGLLVESGDRLYLSEEGLDVSNMIMAEFV
ncbi:MAG: radical SAM family heme chaperone HemW [Emergencia sp.]